jgi:hypothetical protein
MSKERQWETKDSGERQEFDTGAVRDIQHGKGRFDLLGVYSIQRLAGVYERGAVKYGPRNYEKGIPLSRYVDSALRHLFQYLEGDRSEDHASQCAWNVMSLIQTEEMIHRGLLPEELDDLPHYKDREENT